VNQANKD
jgi:hypothetical protein